MTFLEFDTSIMRDEVLGRLLPMQCKRTFPWLRLEEGVLCACYVGFRAVPAPGGAKAFPPAYYLKIAYPGRILRSYERLVPERTAGEPMTPSAPETIRRLMSLCGRAFALFDEKGEGLEAVLAEYNGLLRSALEPKQLAVLERFGVCEP